MTSIWWLVLYVITYRGRKWYCNQIEECLNKYHLHTRLVSRCWSANHFHPCDFYELLMSSFIVMVRISIYPSGFEMMGCGFFSVLSTTTNNNSVILLAVELISLISPLGEARLKAKKLLYNNRVNNNLPSINTARGAAALATSCAPCEKATDTAAITCNTR